MSIAFFVWVGILLPTFFLTWLDDGFYLGEGLLAVCFAFLIGLFSIFLFGLLTHKIYVYLTPVPETASLPVFQNGEIPQDSGSA
jgi:hypothetical protein